MIPYLYNPTFPLNSNNFFFLIYIKTEIDIFQNINKLYLVMIVQDHTCTAPYNSFANLKLLIYIKLKGNVVQIL